MGAETVNRQDMVEAVKKAMRPEFGHDVQDVAEAVLDAVLPQITDAKQMADLPPYSWVSVQVMGGVEVLEWDGSRLNGGLRIDKLPQLPEKVIAMYGPITVVARP